MPERSYPLPADEHARLQALLELQILDTPAEEAFDDLTRLAALTQTVPCFMLDFPRVYSQLPDVVEAVARHSLAEPGKL